LRRSLLLRVQLVRFLCLQLRARSAICAARRHPEPWKLLAQARRDIKQLLREGVPAVTAWAHLLEACVTQAEGDSNSARRLLEHCIGELGSAELFMDRAAAQRRLGELIGGVRGDTLIQTADATLKKQRVQKPTKVADLLAPGHFASSSSRPRSLRP
jgi:hypothetical protein